MILIRTRHWGAIFRPLVAPVWPVPKNGRSFLKNNHIIDYSNKDPDKTTTTPVESMRVANRKLGSWDSKWRSERVACATKPAGRLLRRSMVTGKNKAMMARTGLPKCCPCFSLGAVLFFVFLGNETQGGRGVGGRAGGQEGGGGVGGGHARGGRQGQ